ncbi:MAG: tryptophan-rich sensory protein [Acholeplasmataceae bacterium]
MALLIRVIALLFYALVVVMNGLANVLPFGGRTTAEVSADYPNLFTPTGFTFSIWGVIYLLLGGFVVHVLMAKENVITDPSFKILIGLFAVSSILNVSWLLAWHNDAILLSVIVMVALLVAVGLASSYAEAGGTLARVAFGTYFGWVSIALIANVTVLLKRVGFTGFGFEEVNWLILILLVGLVIGMLVLFRERNVAYGLVFIWAYVGILVKHLSSTGWDRAYPSAIVVLIICLAVLSITTGYAFFRNDFALVER